MLELIAPGGERAVARCDLLGNAPYSDMEDGLYRAYLTPAYAAAQSVVGQWMREAGMDVRIDPARNLVGCYHGTSENTAALLIGSHLDSVRDAGRYDGPLGIMLAVEAIDALNRSGRRLPFPIEVIAFGDEEGSRFPAAMLTSRAVAGTLAAEALDVEDGDGLKLAQAGVDIANYLTAARRPGSTLAYLETHIEQGPVLEAQDLAVGTVTGIAAQLRYQVVTSGQANHAGTTTMTLRRDALSGAAEMIMAIEKIAKAEASDLVATVGQIEALPGAANVIPGEVHFTIDIRSGNEDRRDRAAQAILQALESIASTRSLAMRADLIHNLPASPCAPSLIDMLDEAIGDTGQRPFRLVSGAGHDAMVMASLCPTVMLFVRCKDGISHNPAEYVDPTDAQVALDVMLGFIDRLGASLVT
jgi:allantoate deiminase